MNAHAREWVEALRSGDYEQGRETLRDDLRFCCLGVACDIYRKSTGYGIWADDVFHVAGHEADKVLPRPVRDWLGLRSNAGSYRAGKDESRTLTARNDEGATFEEIASIVESDPAGLFIT